MGEITTNFAPGDWMKFRDLICMTNSMVICLFPTNSDVMSESKFIVMDPQVSAFKLFI